MPRKQTQAEKLAASLQAAHAVQADSIVQSERLSRSHLERLVRIGFLQEITRGWYYLQNPSQAPGTTAWYEHYWSFIRQFLASRLEGEDYCLRPEPSLRLHAGSTVIPEQIIVNRSGKGQTFIKLPYGSSLLIHQDRSSFPMTVTEISGIKVLTMTEALVRVPASFFERFSNDAGICLVSIRDPSDILRLLLEGNMVTAAGRLAGAFRHIGMGTHADRILKSMKSAGIVVQETNPFDKPLPALSGGGRQQSPYVARLQLMWASMRHDVLSIFPRPPGSAANAEGYVQQMDRIYVEDAYHSLSIEGYQVSTELIDKIRPGQWNANVNSSDRETLSAFAAKGYLEAFQLVKQTITKVIDGEDAAKLVREVHHDWHQALFSVSVQSGLLTAVDLAGYRRNPVFIRNSRHVPLPDHALLDAMETLFTMLEEEVEPAVRAVLGHFIFVYIHPYQDGNGRMARFLMNAMLASGGFPWTIIRSENRDRYFAALEAASVELNVRPFAEFVHDELRAAENCK